MSDARRGLPLLSEPPPTFAPPDSEIACRKCSKEFNLIFVRSRKCNHCGYLYCHSCSDFQALMPRLGSDTGYDPMHVCGFCIEFLTITAAGRNSLKALPLAKLKKYMLSYDIRIDRAVEKDDIIDGIVAARGPSGCLSRANENFYRKYSVPNRASSGRTRGLFSRSGQGSNSAPPRPPPRPASATRYEFPRPDLEPDHPPQPHTFRPPDGPPPSRPPRPQQQQHNLPPRHPTYHPNSHYSSPPYHHNSPPSSVPPRPSYVDGGLREHQSPYGYGGHVPPTPPYMTRPQPSAQQSPPHPNYHSHSSPPRAAPHTSAPPPPPPPPPPPRPRATSTAPPPNLDQLVEMTTDSIGSLSISTLKSILFTNHVTTGQILEKGDLVKKVLALVEDEKAERARQRLMEEREEMERIQREIERIHGTSHFEPPTEEQERDEEGDREANHPESGFVHDNDTENKETDSNHETHHSHNSSPPISPPRSKPTGSTSERPGICVICQDDDANIAIIDCGHMAMCRACSELVMASSRECPLCRTRIVTEARLLRIFRT